MPSLNNEICHQIFHKLSCNENTLKKFMLSGKQNFLIALNEFFHTTEVIVGDRDLVITIECENGKPTRYFVGHNFPLLKSLLNAFCSSYGTLSISSWPMNNENIDYSKMIGKNLTKLILSSCRSELPDNVKQLINETWSIKIVETRISTFSKIPVIPPSCDELILKSFDFEQFLNSKPQNISFANVEKLVVDDGDYLPNDIKIMKIKRFSSFISENFPNLKDIKMEFRFDHRSWKDMFEKIQMMQPNLFQNIPYKVKGIIKFAGEYNIEYYYSFVNAARNSGNFDIKESYGDVDVTKTFTIHDGLTFEFNGFFEDPSTNFYDSDSDFVLKSD